MSVVADLVPSVSIDAILMRRETLRDSLATVVAAYEKAIDARYALFGRHDCDLCGGTGDAHEQHRSSRSMEHDLRMDWHATDRDLNDKDQLDLAYKRVDAECWAHLLEKSGMRALMDATMRKEWDDQLKELAMPEFIAANIEATFVGLYESRSDIFEEGVVNVFKKLSWSYKTNSPVKFGKRQIHRFACEANVWWQNKNTDRARRSWHFYGPTYDFCDKLDDLVRAFRVLEGKPEFGRDQGAHAMLRRCEWFQGEADIGKEFPNEMELHGYLKFRGFKNRNAHVTFLRLDLVDKLNQIIAKRFPNALPPSREDA